MPLNKKKKNANQTKPTNQRFLLLGSSWCNGYSRWKWTRQTKFKSWTKLLCISHSTFWKAWISLCWTELKHWLVSHPARDRGAGKIPTYQSISFRVCHANAVKATPIPLPTHYTFTIRVCSQTCLRYEFLVQGLSTRQLFNHELIEFGCDPRSDLCELNPLKAWLQTSGWKNCSCTVLFKEASCPRKSTQPLNLGG